MTSKLTREENVQAVFDLKAGYTLGLADVEILKRVARMALAAMDSEPVGYFGRFDPDDEDLIDQCSKNVKGAFPLYRHAQPAPVVPVVPEGLNPETTDLVLRFASALADKLYKAEQKYGRSTDWMKDDWYDDCLQSLWEHIEKGDPRDVAAYCAFMWYHGWVTTDYDRNVQNACRAAMLQAGNSPVTPDGSEDTKRLDWLDAQNKRLNEYYGTSYGWKFDANFQRNAMMLNDSNYPVMNVRQAIDEAIAEAPKQENI